MINGTNQDVIPAQPPLIGTVLPQFRGRLARGQPSERLHQGQLMPGLGSTSELPGRAQEAEDVSCRAHSRTRLPRQIIRPPDPGRSTSTGTRVYIASSLLANSCATSGLGNLVPALGRAVPAHRMRTASQLRENSQGSPWYAACSICRNLRAD